MFYLKSTKQYTLASIICCFLLFTSCASKKNVLYFQDADTKHNQAIAYSNPKIQFNDILSVKISALHPETVIPYNFDNSISTNSSFIETLKLQGYLVSAEGYIIFPILGKVKASGMTVAELEIHIKNILIEGDHVKDPIVSVRVLNSKITILGEVNAPGTYTLTEQNVTLPQALGYAGDLNIHADRKQILLMRDVDGVRVVKHIDLTQTDWFNSPHYFIKQNDVIVVNPNNTRIKSSGYVGSVGTILTIASILLSTVVIITK